MTKQTRGSNRKDRRGDPDQDVQPWLGWIAALLVVVIVVVAVAMGMERTGNQRNEAAEVRMTPLVGGMEVPVATETSAAVAASEVTPLPVAMTETATISTVTVITATGAMTGTDTFPATGEMTPTATLSTTTEMTVTETITQSAEVTATVEATATEEITPEVTVEPTTEPTATEEPTVEATETTSPTAEATPEATASPTASPTPRPTATRRPTVTPTVVVQNFEAGDIVVASGGRVEIYADASAEALVLESFGTGIELEVLDPSGDFEEYPVIVDGHAWVRVRAVDGLVGWVMSDQVEVQ